MNASQEFRELLATQYEITNSLDPLLEEYEQAAKDKNFAKCDELHSKLLNIKKQAIEAQNKVKDFAYQYCLRNI